ncbi:MAG: LysR family transcriptional regulator [Nitrospiraceae bacterium]|nr:MAG: LysR family transcriptional regulator [Nitrospiraceae bacterium]
MDIHHLRVFTSVYKRKSFSKAAEELHLTQPTVSDHIKALEEELNCRLFDRLSRKIIPTREAEILFIHASEIIERLTHLREAVGSLKKEVAGELIIGASTIPGTYLLPRAIAGFRTEFPAVFFQIIVSDSREIMEKMLDHELLLGIVGTRASHKDLHSHALLQDELIVVAAPSLVRQQSMALRELIGLPMVLREEGSGTRKEMEKNLEGKGISLDNLNVAGYFSSTDAVKQAVKAGMGISILSRFSVQEELKHRTLREVKVAGLEMKRHFYVLTHRKRSLPLLYSVFLENLKISPAITAS